MTLMVRPVTDQQPRNWQGAESTASGSVGSVAGLHLHSLPSSSNGSARSNTLDYDLRNAPSYHAAIMRLLPSHNRHRSIYHSAHSFPSDDNSAAGNGLGARSNTANIGHRECLCDKERKHSYRKDWRTPQQQQQQKQTDKQRNVQPHKVLAGTAHQHTCSQSLTLPSHPKWQLSFSFDSNINIDATDQSEYIAMCDGDEENENLEEQQQPGDISVTAQNSRSLDSHPLHLASPSTALQGHQRSQIPTDQTAGHVARQYTTSDIDKQFKSSTVYLEVKMAELLSKQKNAVAIPSVHRFKVCWKLLGELSRMNTPFMHILSTIRQELDKSLHSTYLSTKNGCSSIFQRMSYFELLDKLEARKYEMEGERENLKIENINRETEIASVEEDIEDFQEKLIKSESQGKDLERNLCNVLGTLETTLAQVRTLHEEVQMLKGKMHKARVEQAKAQEIQYDQMLRKERYAKLEQNYNNMYQDLQDARSKLDKLRRESCDSVPKQDLEAAKAQVEQQRKTLADLQAEAAAQTASVGRLTPRPSWDDILAVSVTPSIENMLPVQDQSPNNSNPNTGNASATPTGDAGQIRMSSSSSNGTTPASMTTPTPAISGSTSSRKHGSNSTGGSVTPMSLSIQSLSTTPSGFGGGCSSTPSSSRNLAKLSTADRYVQICNRNVILTDTLSKLQANCAAAQASITELTRQLAGPENGDKKDNNKPAPPPSPPLKLNGKLIDSKIQKASAGPKAVDKKDKKDKTDQKDDKANNKKAKKGPKKK